MSHETTDRGTFGLASLFRVTVAAAVAVLPVLKWDIGAWPLSIVAFCAAFAAIRRWFFLAGLLVLLLMMLFPAVS